MDYKDGDAHAAAIQGNLVQVKKLDESGYLWDKQDTFGDTPLMESIMYGHRNVAGFLIDKVSPATMEMKNRNNWNALHLMAKYGRPWRGIWNRIVENAPQCLVQKDTEGRTPIELLQLLSSKSEGHALLKTVLEEDAAHAAAVQGNLIQVKKLEESGYPLDKQDKFGETPLMESIMYGHRNVAGFLIDKVSPASTEIQNTRNNWNALHLMAKYGRPWRGIWNRIVENAPQCLVQKDTEGRTPTDLLQLLSSKSEGHASLKSILDEDYITSRAKDLVINGDLEEVKQLYSDGYPLKTQNLVGQTSLMLAIKHRREDIAKFLAKIIPESDVSIEDNRSRNALHYLAMLERPWKEVWQILSQKCPQLLYKNDEDKMSPMELVIMMQHKSSEHKSLYEYVMKNDLPRFVRELDEEAIRNYLGGLEEHAEETRNIKMMFIGHAMVGKTCLVKQLFGEHIDLQSHHSTNVAELHLRRLLLDMLTLERITGTSAKDIVLERLRMVSSKIKEDNRRIEPEPESRLIKECDTTDPPIMPVHREDTDVSHDALISETDFVRSQSKSGLPTAKLTQQQKEVINLVLHQEVNDLYESKAFVTMYDFGGEDVFYNTHHSLMTSDSIYLLVFNAAACLKEDGENEGLESIVKWLQSIAIYAVDVEESKKGTPPVLMIGSHMDLIEGPEVIKKEKLAKFLDKLKSVPGIPEIMEKHIKGFFPISHLYDSSKNKDVFLKMWKTIAEIAPLQSQWKKRIPGKWIALEFELLQKKESGVKVMTIEELMEMNKELTLPLDGVGNLKLFLRYLHLTGFMLCFDLESDNPIIVLNPQWVIDAFKYLITAIKFVCGLTDAERTLWKEFEETGRLPVEVLKMLWGKHPDSKFLDHMYVLVAVMERLGLLVKPLPNDKDDKVNYYVVPGMLKTAGDEETKLMENIVSESTTVKSGTLCIQFQKRFIPRAIWDKFIAACIHRFQPFVVPGKSRFNNCYRGFVALAIDPIWNILIHCSGNVMKLTLFKMKGDCTVVPGTGHAIRVVLAEVLQQILTMNKQGHLKFDYYLHCHPIVRPRDEAVEAKLLLQTSPLICVQIDAGVQKTELIHRQHYDVWFQSLAENSAQVSGVDIQRRPTYRELGRIAKFIYEAHHMFFIELGLQDAEISGIRQTCGHLSFRTQVTKIFLSWSNPRLEVSLQQIVMAMNSHGLDSTSMMTELEQIHTEDNIIPQGTGIPEYHLQRIPEPKEVETIATFVDTSYFNLFLELGLEPHIIARFEMDHKHSGVKTLFIELLNIWIKESGDKATINSLLMAMKECNMDVHAVTQELSEVLLDDIPYEENTYL